MRFLITHEIGRFPSGMGFANLKFIEERRPFLKGNNERSLERAVVLDMANISSFCPCDDYECVNNPRNHDKGCSLCVEDSLKDGEIPKCFFLEVTESVDGFTDWSYGHFAKLALEKK